MRGAGLYAVAVTLAWVSLLVSPPSWSASRLEAVQLANDVLIHANEGIGDPRVIERRLLALDGGSASGATEAAAYTDLHGALQNLLQAAETGTELSWEMPGIFAKAIREILAAEQANDTESALILEFISLQYLSRAYLGYFELAPEHEQALVAKNEIELATLVEPRLHLATGSRQRSTWLFVRRALDGQAKDSKVSITQRSAPLVVYRGIRQLATYTVTATPESSP